MKKRIIIAGLGLAALALVGASCASYEVAETTNDSAGVENTNSVNDSETEEKATINEEESDQVDNQNMSGNQPESLNTLNPDEYSFTLKYPPILTKVSPIENQWIFRDDGKRVIVVEVIQKTTVKQRAEREPTEWSLNSSKATQINGHTALQQTGTAVNLGDGTTYNFEQTLVQNGEDVISVFLAKEDDASKEIYNSMLDSMKFQ